MKKLIILCLMFFTVGVFAGQDIYYDSNNNWLYNEEQFIDGMNKTLSTFEASRFGQEIVLIVRNHPTFGRGVLVGLLVNETFEYVNGIRVKFDNKALETFPVTMSTNCRVLLVEKNEGAEKFISKIKVARKVLIEIRTLNSGIVCAEFNLTGFNENLLK